MTADKLVECPQCGGRLERLIGAGAGMIFKGSGFYTTDYRSESYRSAREGESKDGTTKTSDAAGEGAKPAKGEKQKSAKKDANKAAD
jgi:predicted nucleic acid-binding Zn ribbon protein